MFLLRRIANMPHTKQNKIQFILQNLQTLTYKYHMSTLAF